MTVQAPTRDKPFYGYSDKMPKFQSSFTTRIGIRRTFSRLRPRGPPRGDIILEILDVIIHMSACLNV